MRRGAVFLFGLAILAASGVFLWRAQHSVASAGPAGTRSAPTVHVASVAQRDVPIYVRGIGQAQPFNTVQLKSRVDGQIDRILFTEGQQVSAGDPLIEIDPRPYQAAVGQAEGTLAKDQAQLVSAKADLDRSSSLLKNGYASRQAFDQQTAAVGQLTATIKADQATLDAARLNLQFSTIRAPITGRVGKRLVDAGNVVHTADDTDLAEIVQLKPITVLFTVPQDALPDIQAGQRRGALVVEARSGNDQKRLAEGRLTLIGNQIDAQTGTIELKALFENTDETLWPGQFLNARIVTSTRKDAVTVPMAAVQTGIRGKFVYVLDGSASTVTPRDVGMLQSVHGLAVVDGLKPGETVVVDNQDQLAPGMVVKVEPGSNDPMALGPRAEATPS
ncbi:MAG TPA: efflux RND transporter periplasmic adaptor subunit [Aliidongia sp.]|uniref:efflux RND transporter periplasmic adaptor subunit n=1 Tax=Aliidongia sp. TaxID=1914230 RepID=UPI002DDD006F|nr:efflux RND transporter periplasmic adaptor subunit [Aliidongia sp.]HEV2677951.1 efflux RND transporter periplasmic adaptor subunit [Aliidongia sp.]